MRLRIAAAAACFICLASRVLGIGGVGAVAASVAVQRLAAQPARMAEFRPEGIAALAGKTVAFSVLVAAGAVFYFSAAAVLNGDSSAVNGLVGLVGVSAGGQHPRTVGGESTAAVGQGVAFGRRAVRGGVAATGLLRFRSMADAFAATGLFIKIVITGFVITIACHINRSPVFRTGPVGPVQFCYRLWHGAHEKDER